MWPSFDAVRAACAVDGFGMRGALVSQAGAHPAHSLVPAPPSPAPLPPRNPCLAPPPQYYYGSRNDIQRATVQNIFNSVMKELAWNPDRTFTEIEIAFFARWWADASDQMQDLVRQLVKSGSLEFLNGAWFKSNNCAVLGECRVSDVEDLVSDPTTRGRALTLHPILLPLPPSLFPQACTMRLIPGV
jgi:hypothetical protein